MAQMTGKAPASLLMLALFSFMPLASAHTARVTMDPRGISATFTALARVTCFDDGNGPPAALQVRLRDNSPPVAGLLVSIQLLKGRQAISYTERTGPRNRLRQGHDLPPLREQGRSRVDRGHPCAEGTGRSV